MRSSYPQTIGLVTLLVSFISGTATATEYAGKVASCKATDNTLTITYKVSSSVVLRFSGPGIALRESCEKMALLSLTDRRFEFVPHNGTGTGVDQPARVF